MSSVISKKKPPYAWTLPALIFLCLSIDFFEMMTSAGRSEMLGHFSCAIKPYLFLSYPLFSDSLLDFSQSACAMVHYQEPLSSIVFYMIKLHLSLGLMLFNMAYLIGNAAGQLHMHMLIESARRTSTGFLDYLLDKGAVPLGLFLFALFSTWTISIVGMPERYLKAHWLVKLTENWVVFIFAIFWLIFVPIIWAGIRAFLPWRRR